MKKAPRVSQAHGASAEQLTLLPPPPFSPSWPKRGSLPDRALKALMDGRLIDHEDFIESASSWRLAAAIFTLRTLGWPVERTAPDAQALRERAAAARALGAER